MNMKNMRFLALAAIFASGSILPMGSFGPSKAELTVYSGGLVGAAVIAVLGVQKGTVLAQKYGQSLGILAEPVGGLLGGSVGFVVGAIVGMAVTDITLQVKQFIREKSKLAKAKLEKMKQEYI